MNEKDMYIAVLAMREYMLTLERIMDQSDPLIHLSDANLLTRLRRCYCHEAYDTIRDFLEKCKEEEATEPERRG